ncbi:hypothetical protein F5146DRAFT_1007008 [Armillaria mellea]|nr:hypothetical protein F5146DRAFT_1007008 [Armillaria mellea]
MSGTVLYIMFKVIIELPIQCTNIEPVLRVRVMIRDISLDSRLRRRESVKRRGNKGWKRQHEIHDVGRADRDGIGRGNHIAFDSTREKPRPMGKGHGVWHEVEGAHLEHKPPIQYSGTRHW